MRTYFLLCLMAASVLLLCCDCSYGKIPRKKKLNPDVETVMNVQVDDSVKHMLGDSISRVIFEADTIRLFSLSVKQPVDSFAPASEKSDSVAHPDFHGCFISHDYGVLSKSAANPILLILSDKENYLPDSVQLKSPFTPSVALSFKKKDAAVDIVFSFTGGQMLVFMANDEKLYFKYTYERLTMRFFQSYLLDEQIANYLYL